MMKKLSCLVLGVIVLAAAVGGRPSSAQTPVSADEIRFVMPSGWVKKEAPAPGTLAYYVLMYQGKPYGEMYLSKEPLSSALSARQVLEEGLRKNSAGLQGYHPMGTFPVSAAGVSDAVAHDFTYFPAQSPVPFTGRVVVLVVGNASYTFFFNTTSSFFPSVKGSFGDVTASIQAVPKPPVQEVKKAEPRTVEEHGFTMTLAGGWSDSGDAMGAKYRYAGADGHYLASFFPFGKDEKAGVTALFALMEKGMPWKRCSLQRCGMIFRATATIPQWTHSGEKSPEAMRSSMISAPGRKTSRSCSACASLRSVPFLRTKRH